MHGCAAAGPFYSSVKIAKRSEADGQETCQGLRSNRVAAWPLLVGGDQKLSGWGVGVSRRRRLHPATRRARCGQRPSVGKTPGGRAVGIVCRRHSFLGVKGFWVYKAQSQLCVALLGCLVIGGRMSPVSLKLPHAPCAPLSLDNLQVLVQSLPVALS